MADIDRILERFTDTTRQEYGKPFCIGAWTIATRGCVLLAVKTQSDLKKVPCPLNVRALVGDLIPFKSNRTIELSALISWCQEMLVRQEYGIVCDMPIDLDLLSSVITDFPWKTSYLEQVSIAPVPALFLGGPGWRFIQAAVRPNCSDGLPVFDAAYTETNL